MTVKIPALSAGVPIVDQRGAPSTQFHQWWQNSVGGIVNTLNRLSRLTSHTDPTTILTAVDDGTTSTITIADHNRVFGDGSTLAITGGTLTEQPANAAVALYYDDPTGANKMPTFLATTVIKDAQAVSGEHRYFLGVIYTPVAGSGATQTGGGAYPIGSSVGGEV